MLQSTLRLWDNGVPPTQILDRALAIASRITHAKELLLAIKEASIGDENIQQALLDIKQQINQPKISVLWLFLDSPDNNMPKDTIYNQYDQWYLNVRQAIMRIYNATEALSPIRLLIINSNFINPHFRKNHEKA